MDIFLYGTLRHRPLLDMVLGDALPEARLTPATLPGASVTWVAGESYPMIRLNVAGASASGLLLRDVTEPEQARLSFFEGAFGYDLCDVQTNLGAARVFVPGSAVGPAGAPWSLQDWVHEWGALSVEAAREVVRHRGTKTPADIARMFPGIRLRAAARVRGAARTDPPRFDLDISDRRYGYAGFFALEDMQINAETFDGGRTGPLQRAVFLGMDATIVLPYDPVRDRVLLVEQVRMGPIGRGEPDPWLLEPVAGHIDPGETPQEAAFREAREEAGIELRELRPVSSCFPSPGNSSEFFEIFVGLADLPDSAAGVGGVAEEGENIRAHVLGFDQFMEMIDSRQARVAPLVLAGYWLALNRARLRRG